MPILTDHHHLFLQALLLRRAAPYTTWETIFKRCRTLVEARDRESDFSTLVRDINTRLEHLGFRIAFTVDGGIGSMDESQRDQVDDETGGGIYPRTPGERWMGLINTRVDNSSKLATELTPAELNLFRRVISRIIRAPNFRYCISSHEAIRLHSKIQGMKKSDAQNVLNVLVKKGWLSHVGGIYTLSIRAQLELEPYFENNFERDELPAPCVACKNTVMRGYHCPNDTCRGALHAHCEVVWKRNNSKCTVCKGNWSNQVPIGQDAPDAPISDTEEEESDPEAKEEEEEGTQETQTRTQTQVKKSSKRRSTASSQKTQKKSRNSKAPTPDSDDDDDDRGEGPSQARGARSTASRRSSRYG